MARSIPPRMHFRRWFKLHSRSPYPAPPVLREGEVRQINYDSYPPQVDDKLKVTDPLPLRTNVFPKPKT